MPCETQQPKCFLLKVLIHAERKVLKDEKKAKLNLFMPFCSCRKAFLVYEEKVRQNDNAPERSKRLCSA